MLKGILNSFVVRVLFPYDTNDVPAYANGELTPFIKGESCTLAVEKQRHFSPGEALCFIRSSQVV